MASPILRRLQWCPSASTSRQVDENFAKLCKAGVELGSTRAAEAWRDLEIYVWYLRFEVVPKRRTKQNHLTCSLVILKLETHFVGVGSILQKNHSFDGQQVVGKWWTYILPDGIRFSLKARWTPFPPNLRSIGFVLDLQFGVNSAGIFMIVGRITTVALLRILGLFAILSHSLDLTGDFWWQVSKIKATQFRHLSTNVANALKFGPQVGFPVGPQRWF